jgi:hypothetical protein
LDIVALREEIEKSTGRSRFTIGNFNRKSVKNYPGLALTIFLMVAFTEVQAQVKHGYIFGMNLSTMTLKTKDLTSKPDMPAGVHFGGFFELPLSGPFALQSGLLFSAKGSNYKIDTTEFSISPIYIEIPVMIACSFGSDIVKVSLFAGPYFAYGLGGYKIESGSDLKNINFGNGFYSDMRPFDAGFNFGAGINIRGFLVSVQYGIGLTNLAPSIMSDSVMKNKVIGISVCTLIEGKER